MFTAEVKVDVGPLFAAIQADLERRLAAAAARVAAAVLPEARAAVAASLKKQPHYKALLPGGELAGHFGLTPEGGWADRIVAAVAASVVSETLTPAGVSVSAFRSRFEDALDSDAASFLTKKGASIEWLDWLLFQGDRVIIASHFYSDRPTFAGARSGQGRFMLPAGKKRSGWRVPAAFAGFEDGNWLTKAADEAGPIILDVLVRAARAEVGA